MIATIVLAYAVIIGLDDALAGGVVRLLMLGYLLWEAVSLRDSHRMWRRSAVWVGTALAMAGLVAVNAVASFEVTSGVVGGVSLLFTAAVIAIVGRAVVESTTIDTRMVLGVLSVYLLLALFFASLNQLFSAFTPGGYLNGVTGLPSAADHLYFSVITMATVGYGDITPASQIARAVAVVEALTGQLYLVSVVAAVIGGWHRRS